MKSFGSFTDFNLSTMRPICVFLEEDQSYYKIYKYMHLDRKKRKGDNASFLSLGEEDSGLPASFRLFKLSSDWRLHLPPREAGSELL